MIARLVALLALAGSACYLGWWVHALVRQIRRPAIRITGSYHPPPRRRQKRCPLCQRFLGPRPHLCPHRAAR